MEREEKLKRYAKCLPDQLEELKRETLCDILNIKETLLDYIKGDQKIHEFEACSYLDLIKRYICLPECQEKDMLYQLIGKTIENYSPIINQWKEKIEEQQIIKMFCDSEEIDFHRSPIIIANASSFLSKKELIKTNNGMELDKIGIEKYISYKYDKAIFKDRMFCRGERVAERFTDSGVINIFSYQDFLFKKGFRPVKEALCYSMIEECQIRTAKQHDGRWELVIHLT